MTQSNGLTQLFQIKYGLRLNSEDLSTTFISYYSISKKYFNTNENNIFEVAGAIGTHTSKFKLRD